MEHFNLFHISFLVLFHFWAAFLFLLGLVRRLGTRQFSAASLAPPTGALCITNKIAGGEDDQEEKEMKGNYGTNGTGRARALVCGEGKDPGDSVGDIRRSVHTTSLGNEC